MATSILPANPFLVCDYCNQRVSEITNTGENEGPAINLPCGHRTGATSKCPSWSPIDGCNCKKHLGYVPHVTP